MSLVMNVAIVGSEEQYWGPEQKIKAMDFIRTILPFQNYHTVLVSGGCPRGGIDIWAEEIADELEMGKLIHIPEINQWNSVGRIKGYKARNYDIAKDCDVLFCIEPEYKATSPFTKYITSKDGKSKGRRSGGVWTFNRAYEMHKPCHMIIIPVEGDYDHTQSTLMLKPSEMK